MRKTSNKHAKSTKSKQRKTITFRMNVLFFSIFLLFTMLILRLGYIQIVKGEDYTSDLEKAEEVRINTGVPRGRIFDREGRILVDNLPLRAITYTKMQTTKSKDMYIIAEKLSALIEKKPNNITKSDLQDFWLKKYPKEAQELVSEEERKEIETDKEIEKKEQNRAIDRLVRSRIMDEQLNSFTPEELEIIAIYREMAAGYALTPQIIKGDDIKEEVTVEEFARVSERLGELEGVNTTTDWRRVKTSSLAILGSTTLPKTGIPKERLDYFLSRGYSRNDRVGTSYIEQQYEEVLQGQKSVVKNITDGKGRVVDTQTVYEGKPGRDLVLTMDSEVQLAHEEILTEELLKFSKNSGSQYLQNIYFIMIDPYTGEILSLVGKRLGKNEKTGAKEVYDYAFGTFTNAYEVGSTVKPGTILTGYREGVYPIGGSLVDEPILIKGSQPKSSVFNRSGSIRINDLQALELSSNVYMFKTAYGIAGSTYRPNQPINFGKDAFLKMRSGYAQLGLGALTEIDLPGEVNRVPDGFEDGKLLDLSIGQYDTYTTLQLAQFVSTLANGGNRIQPHVVKEIREPSEDGVQLGNLVKEITPTILNTVDNTREEIERVRQGMRLVYFSSRGTANKAFGNASFTGGGKTGTAQSSYFDTEMWQTFNTVNLTHIGFAPYENPEIAYALVIPHASLESSYKTNFATPIARRLVDKYFEIKQKNNTTSVNDLTISPFIKPAFTNTKIDEEETK